MITAIAFDFETRTERPIPVEEAPKFAKTLSFLLYEIWDHLIDSYTKVLRTLEDEVERVEAQIFATVDDEVFGYVGRVTRGLLSLRKIVLSARDVLHELATRRSPFVSDAAQPYLHNMAGKLERLGSDLSVERETLAETGRWQFLVDTDLLGKKRTAPLAGPLADLKAGENLLPWATKRQ